MSTAIKDTELLFWDQKIQEFNGQKSRPQAFCKKNHLNVRRFHVMNFLLYPSYHSESEFKKRTALAKEYLDNPEGFTIEEFAELNDMKVGSFKHAIRHVRTIERLKYLKSMPFPVPMEPLPMIAYEPKEPTIIYEDNSSILEIKICEGAVLAIEASKLDPFVIRTVSSLKKHLQKGGQNAV